MKLICKKSDLIAGINIAMKAVSSKTTMSILECILIDATQGEIKFTSKEPVGWTLDGEFGGEHTELTIKNLQKRIEIIAPIAQHGAIEKK